VGVSLIQTMPSSVIYMIAYERAKKRIQSQYSSDIESNSLRGHIYRFAPALAAGLARLLTVTIISPIELVRTIKTSGSSTEKPIKIAYDIIHNHGLKGLYSGWASTVLRDIPFSMIYWLSFETFRPMLLQSFNTNNIPDYNSPQSYSVSINFLAASVSGLIAAVITHPFDVLKTQQQLSMTIVHDKILHEPVDKCYCMKPVSVSYNVSLYHKMRVIVSETGFKGLYRGLLMRLFTVIPSGAIMISVYEVVKNI
jgi:solute carrier family 25, member 39/40